MAEAVSLELVLRSLAKPSSLFHVDVLVLANCFRNITPHRQRFILRVCFVNVASDGCCSSLFLPIFTFHLLCLIFFVRRLQFFHSSANVSAYFTV